MPKSPKHVDIDKPVGLIKKIYRRWWRSVVKKNTRLELLEELINE